MYVFFLTVQYVGIAVLITEMMFILSKPASKLQMTLLVMTTATLLNFIGYLMEITSTSMETALMGVKVEYLGKPFIMLSLFFFVMHYCHIEIPKIVSGFFMIMHIGITTLVFTCDDHNLFFDSLSFTTEGIFPHLLKGQGPMCIFFMVMTGCFATICIFCAVREWHIAETKLARKQAAYILLMIVTQAIGFALYLSGITGGYDTMNIAYLINVILLAVSIFRYRLFEVLTLAKEKALNDYQDGLIVLDNRNTVIYSNSLAKEIYPELKGEDYQGVIERLDAYMNLEEKLFYKNKVFQIKRQPILQEGMEYGRTYKIIDITDSYYYATRLQNDVEERTKQIKSMQSSVIESFANMIEARDGITGQHVKHTSAYVRILIYGLKETGLYKDLLTDEYIATVIDVAPLHDIGKIAIMDQILKKNDRLTDEEFEAIKTHPQVGAVIAEDILRGVESDSYIKVAHDIILYHHEKWDGTGYPTGLKGNKIPLCARIMAVADVYDALRSKRSYKESFSKEKSRKIIAEGAGVHFDPDIVRVFQEHIDEIERVE